MDSNASNNEWTDPYLLEKFANHEARPSNLLLKPMSGTLPHHHHHSGTGSTTAVATGGTMGRGVTMMMTTTTSGSGLNLQYLPQQAVTTKTGLSPYFHAGANHPMATTSAGGRDSATTTTNLVVQNGVGGSSGDLDINVNVIKNMLLANRVPESCV